MRLISQNGAIDVPYDYFSLTIATGKYEDVEVASIYCHNLSSPKGTKLAEYSSKEKAEKAMEMLRDAYVGTPIVVSDREYTQDEIKAILLGVYVLSVQEEPPRIIESQHGYFQFPKDEDVEV